MTDRDDLAALIWRRIRDGIAADDLADEVLARWRLVPVGSVRVGASCTECVQPLPEEEHEIEAREGPSIGLMQVLSDAHPLVKYGSWDKVPEDVMKRWRWYWSRVRPGLMS